ECGGHANHTAQVDVHFSHQFSEVGCRCSQVPVEHDACVVHQHVEFWKICLHARREGGDFCGIRDIALDGVKFRILRLHLVEHRLAPASHDHLVSEFDELERES